MINDENEFKLKNSTFINSFITITLNEQIRYGNERILYYTMFHNKYIVHDKCRERDAVFQRVGPLSSTDDIFRKSRREIEL